ncbi:MAG: hypothetical protein ACI909_004345 [Planctomycetota bacterium]|jgi:hypothetical protein
MSIYSVDKLIAEARRLAREYREATGKTLAITGEIAINDAIRLLAMSAAPKDGVGFDAIMIYKAQKLRVQIKGRAIVNTQRAGHRLGQLKLEQNWDAIVLVIMDVDFETQEIYLAQREAIVEVLSESKNKRGSISIARFKIIGELLWSAENGIENNAHWSNTD